MGLWQEVRRGSGNLSFFAIVERDIRNFLKYKYWIIVLLVTNLADLLIMAANFANLVTFGTFNYFNFFAPGITVLSIFGASFIMGIEVSQERHTQRIHYLLSLPIKRLPFMVARSFAGAIRSMLFSIPLLIIALIIVGVPAPFYILIIIAILFLLAMGLTSLSIALATAFQSTRRYQLARGFISMYLMFGSTVFYPLEYQGTPIMASIPILNALAEVNPLSYGANLLRSLMDPAKYGAVRELDIIGLLVFSIIMIYVGLYFYDRFTKSA
ncbi:MAG: ABC transporter permease [Candidatus Helarchaeota archaeon]